MMIDKGSCIFGTGTCIVVNEYTYEIVGCGSVQGSIVGFFTFELYVQNLVTKKNGQ